MISLDKLDKLVAQAIHADYHVRVLAEYEQGNYDKAAFYQRRASHYHKQLSA